MAEESKQRNDSDNATTEKQLGASGKPAFWKRLLTLRWFAALLVLTIMIQGSFFTYYQCVAKTGALEPDAEISLGAFNFKADATEKGRIAAANFSLHIALLPQVGEAARCRLDTHKYRVQQDVEELLRQAHSADFDDPSLTELKRQLQEQVNETLGVRAISDVIITDLKLTFSPKRPDGPATETADLVPWVEKPSS